MKRLLALLLVVLMQFVFIPAPEARAATSPSLGTAGDFSVLGGSEVTCTGSTTTSQSVGVSPGTSITGFPSPCTAGGGTHSNNASAIAAQASTLAAFTALDQTCDQSFGAVDLTTTFPSGVGPGVYCSTSSFTLSGNLNLTGSGVHIFKTVTTLITSPGSSVTGGNSCDVWWRIGSAATLNTTTSFRGNILAQTGTTALQTGATLSGRVLGLSGTTVTLDANTITSPSCGAGSSSSSASTPSSLCPVITDPAPIIIESRRVDADSIFISWAQYSALNTFNVQYGFENGKWLFNTNVTGFSTTINNLPANVPIWVRIAARNACSAVGIYGAGKLVGGPRLPNTGFGPREFSSGH